MDLLLGIAGLTISELYERREQFEVVRGSATPVETISRTMKMARDLGKVGAVADLQIALNDGTGTAAEHYDATQITTNAFRLLAQRPALGRDFVLADEQPGAAPVAILRYSFWERRYGKEPSIVGQAIRINGTPTTVIGIMPRDFSFPQNEDLWLPLVPTTDLVGEGL